MVTAKHSNGRIVLTVLNFVMSAALTEVRALLSATVKY